MHDEPNPMLRFYGRHGVSPVTQDIRDVRRHFERRFSLYLQLGIPPALVRGRRVLEVGPGSGHNSLFTASLGPAEYVLVEGNATGRDRVLELFAAHDVARGSFRVVDRTLMEVTERDFGAFDLVLCEGVLCGLQAPAEGLKHLCTLVRPGGVLVVTCLDAVSTLAESVRRLLAYQLPVPEGTVQERARWLLPALEPHLGTLKAMSRLKEDWLVDNILLPLGDGYRLLSFADVARALPDDFQFLSSSPRFARDWRWYKEICGERFGTTATFVNEYWANVHSFLDYRQVHPPREPRANMEFYAECQKFWDLMESFERSRAGDALALVEGCIGHIHDLVGEFSQDTANALGEARALLRRRPFTREDVAGLVDFRGLFGRGMPYASIVNCAR